MTEFIILNDADPANESALGATDVFRSLEEAVFECEYWVSEEPGMRFYIASGERLVAIDHGNRRTFHLEKTGTFFEGFDDLVRREAERREVEIPETGFSAEHVLRAIWERDEAFKREYRGWRTWLMPPRRFREKYGFWAWWLPFLRKEPGNDRGMPPAQD